MILREIKKELAILMKEYPIVTIIGPRQSGKTTLAQSVSKKIQYCNLESPEARLFAHEDPKGFLKQFTGPVIIDEIQRVPDLLSYIQVIVDEKKKNGQFILTGSHQLKLMESISQSLAGRTAILQLLPLTLSELNKYGITFESWSECAWKGFFPRIYDQNQRPQIAYSNYFQTYVEKDVRQLVNIKDLSLFEKLIRILAGRVGQIIDYASMANDVGVDAKTIKNWVSILEASFIIFRLMPYHNNFGKRVIKSPKIYFTDVGLLTFLLKITNPDQILRDPLVGNIFENFVVIELLKSRFNKGLTSNLYFYRDENGFEIDLILDHGRKFTAIEIKSSQTFNTDLVKNLNKMSKITDQIENRILVFNGKKAQVNEIQLVPFHEIGKIKNN
jgi:predicted AAA+ superfamily ATPase